MICQQAISNRTSNTISAVNNKKAEELVACRIKSFQNTRQKRKRKMSCMQNKNLSRTTTRTHTHARMRIVTHSPG